MITIELSRDGWTGGLQLSINQYDEPGNAFGHGYRIFGPKFNGSGEVIKRYVLTERDVTEIRTYLDAFDRDAGKPVIVETNFDMPALADVAANRDPDWYIAQRAADDAWHRMGEDR